ncbi:cysteine--tRNA ligase, partial [Lactobacillus sp. XV13L]|nr:cysteine--tRNA ligase [Lactobacillus sp. XV13L]
SGQYRKQINYSRTNLAQAENILQRFKNTLVNLQYRLADKSKSMRSAALETALDTTAQKFNVAMDDDINVQNALAAIYDLLPEINANSSALNADKQALKKAQQLLTTWLAIFGIDADKLLAQNNEPGSTDAAVVELIKQREAARAAKDWAKSDQLRAQLKERGITVEDTPQGTRWKRD